MEGGNGDGWCGGKWWGENGGNCTGTTIKKCEKNETATGKK